MKSLLSTLVIIMFLAHLVTGGWYVKKCANTLGNCRKMCRDGEKQTEPATSKCPIGKLCCVLDFKISGHCGGGGQNSDNLVTAGGDEGSNAKASTAAMVGAAAMAGTPTKTSTTAKASAAAMAGNTTKASTAAIASTPTQASAPTKANST
uniref:Beta-defensin n=1 Tax=Mus spicilegus TaxID=10103 RepID=A0A8C6G867_MUSSI